MSFKDHLLEAAGSHHTLAFGRMNPPTAGHEAVVKKIHSVSKEHGGGHTLILSHSHATKDGSNPLPPDVKLKHAKRAFPGTNIRTSSSESPTILHHAAEMHKQGVEHLHFVGGSDRKPMHELLKKYNGVKGTHGHYKFKSITFHNAGDRDEKSKGTAGISGTKLRAHAAAGQQSSFESHLSSTMKPEHKTALYHDLRHHMGVKEVFDPHLKISKYQWGEKKGTDHMKKVTPGELPDKLKEMFNRKIPYLLMTEEQKSYLIEAAIPKEQLEFDGIETKFFNMCPTAHKMFGEMIDTIRSGKHIGEIAGHVPVPVTQNSNAVKSVEAGMALKPEHIRQMQFRQYTGL